MSRLASLLVICVVQAAIPCSADRLLIEFQTVVNGFPMARDTPHEPTRVVFTTEPNYVTVVVVAAAAPDRAVQGPLTLQLPGTPWWHALKWHLANENRDDVSFAPDGIVSETMTLAEGSATLHPNDRLQGRFRLPVLEPGIYRLYATLGTLKSRGDWFRVSAGNEDNAMRIAYARFKSLYSHDRRERMQYLLQLAHLQPLNAGAWIELGDLALAYSPQSEVDQYDDHAIQVLQERRNSADSEGKTRVVEGIEHLINGLERLKVLVSRYFADPERLKLVVSVQGGKSYTLEERASHRVVDRINVDGAGQPK